MRTTGPQFTLRALFLACAIFATAGVMAGDKAIVDTADGNYLVDGQGMSLYLFEPDEQGQSTCYDACAKVWPPLVAEEEAVAKGKVDAAMLGEIKRDDGSKQVTYNGWPLYYFVIDKEPGDIKGQDVEGFGGEWYLVAPSGNHMEEEEHEEQEGSSSGSS